MTTKLTKSQKYRLEKAEKEEREKIEKEQKRISDMAIEKEKMIDDFNKKRDAIFSFVIESKDTDTK